MGSLIETLAIFLLLQLIVIICIACYNHDLKKEDKDIQLKDTTNLHQLKKQT